MKKLFSSLGGVIGMLFVLAMFAETITPKKKNRITLKKLIIGVLLIVLAWQIGASIYNHYYPPHNTTVPTATSIQITT